ncbi:guanine deaminase [Acetobacter fabarum]|uniref:guanine deaminase n=1 Tax=Acetobacter fabarum TaxID=483199 RepID=UPI0014049AD4|nr:guanine deaminase [Acetobacter fabarum]NHO41259.1 guanine deaminase [Acetobacter fabarum]GBQ33197.1 guanine deaminase [Acetobacter fabarum DSM 19596]
MPHTPDRHAIRGSYVTFCANPFTTPDALVLEEDGLIIMEHGRITQCGPYATLHPLLGDNTPLTHYPDCLISAGFIDAHVHYPQISAIASWGEQLLPWLEQYIFPTEAEFADVDVARRTARLFLSELLRNGTTTAAVYCTVHPQSVDAFFEESARLGTRMIAGKVLMDRNCPPNLQDTAQSGYDQSAALIARWHGRDRQLYAVTPRFAITSTPEQLELAGTLFQHTPGLYMQTHLAENLDEIAAVRSLFPNRSSYLDVYAKAGLDGPRAIFGHAIHMAEHDFAHCHQSGCTLAHCPTSNLFLGSGAFALFDALKPTRPVHVALGTDVGAGTSLSLLATMGEAYKVSLMAGNTRLSAAQALWLATAGAARALHLHDHIGLIAPGMEADLCVMDPAATPLMAQRSARCTSLAERLFTLMVLGDDRAIRATWANGRLVHARAETQADAAVHTG